VLFRSRRGPAPRTHPQVTGVHMRLAIDFDNVLFVHAFPAVGPLVPGAAEYMQRLHDAGHELVIWSSRASQEDDDLQGEREEGLRAMKAALAQEHIPYDQIDYGDKGKIRADIYVDDHGLGVPLIQHLGQAVLDWRRAFQMIRLQIVAKRLRDHARKA
jgi:hypothetical protein